MSEQQNDISAIEQRIAAAFDASPALVPGTKVEHYAAGSTDTLLSFNAWAVKKAPVQNISITFK